MTLAEEQLSRVGALCFVLPEVTERPSHGAPTFFVRAKKSFASFHDDHHGDGRLALWCAAPAGVQALLVEAAGDVYFRPAYVGHLGWLGVRLDRDLAEDELAGVIEDAYRERAPKRLVNELDGSD
ncbi:MAG: hypothetical protein JWO02_806 [Solirubrobacterales bacterium]|nr:hypothetical protein [Solirubrobacterales bacterium]